MTKVETPRPCTSGHDQTLDMYLHEIGRIRLLSHDEEATLVKRIQDGDEKALERLTTSNLRFVVSVAKQYRNQGLSLADLINEGNIGLIKAARKFDGRGKFFSYAAWWVRQSIVKAIAEQGKVVRLPRKQLNAARKVSKAMAHIEQSACRRPSVDELSEHSRMPHASVREALNTLVRQISADAPLAEGSANSLVDVLANDNAQDSDTGALLSSLREELEAALQCLPERERIVVEAFYGIGCTGITLREIGDKYGMRRERVRQVRDRALRRLRQHTGNKVLKACFRK